MNTIVFLISWERAPRELDYITTIFNYSFLAGILCKINFSIFYRVSPKVSRESTMVHPTDNESV